MTIDFDNIQEFTDAQVLKALRHALVKLTLRGVSYGVPGRSFTSATPDQLQKLIDLYERRIDSASGPVIARARFNRAT